MMEEELIKIWQSSPNQEIIKFEKSRLMIDVQSSLDQFHKKVKYRDLSEQMGGVIGIPVFAYYAYSIQFIIPKVASILVILWGIQVIIRLRNAKKQKPGAFTETYLEYLYKTREYLKIQKHMMDNVLYWYILPAWVILSMFLLGPIGVPGKLPVIIQTEALGISLSIALYFLNKRAVKKQFIPRLQKIDELIKVMEKS